MPEFVKLYHPNMHVDDMRWHLAQLRSEKTVCSIAIGVLWGGTGVQAVIRTNELPLPMCRQCMDIINMRPALLYLQNPVP